MFLIRFTHHPYRYPVAVLAFGKASLYQNILVMNYFNTKLGRLRIIAFLEGLSLLVLTGIAVPMKYAGNDPSLVKTMGPIHGLLFLLFIINTISVGIEYKWRFKETTWKVLLACIIPFGTFYIDRKILRKMDNNR